MCYSSEQILPESFIFAGETLELGVGPVWGEDFFMETVDVKSCCRYAVGTN